MMSVFIIIYYDENNVEHVADFVFSDYLKAFNYAFNLKHQKVLIAKRVLKD